MLAPVRFLLPTVTVERIHWNFTTLFTKSNLINPTTKPPKCLSPEGKPAPQVPAILRRSEIVALGRCLQFLRAPQRMRHHKLPKIAGPERCVKYRPANTRDSDIIKIILAIILPPLGVFLERGCGADLLINIVLTCLGYIPGIIHALYVTSHSPSRGF